MRIFGKDDLLIAKVRDTVKQRFFSRVNKDRDECWRYQRKGISGYSYFQWGKSKSSPAHRVALIWSDKAYKAKMYACHTCPTKNCVNPNHLYWGTAQNNIDDCIRSGHFKATRARGAASKFANLNESQVMKIIEMCCETKMPYTEIGEFFGVTGQCVRHIDRKKTWTHIRRPESNRPLNTFISKEIAISIFNGLKKGNTVKEVAAEHSVSANLVSSISQGRTWADLTGGKIKR